MAVTKVTRKTPRANSRTKKRSIPQMGKLRSETTEDSQFPSDTYTVQEIFEATGLVKAPSNGVTNSISTLSRTPLFVKNQSAR